MLVRFPIVDNNSQNLKGKFSGSKFGEFCDLTLSPSLILSHKNTDRRRCNTDTHRHRQINIHTHVRIRTHTYIPVSFS